jgi:hypothetical protein
MGFALWIDGDHALAQGTHEYRPMGAAVVGVNCVFTPRDFHRRRPTPSRMSPGFVGLFASLGEMNDFLARRGSRSQEFEKNFQKRKSLGPPEF